MYNQQTRLTMAKKKTDEPIRVLEILSYSEGGFEIRMAQFETTAVPLIVGLLEKVKFNLLASDYDENGAADEILSGVNMTNKYEA